MRGRWWRRWLIGGWLILYAGAIDAVPLLVLTDREPPFATEWAYALHRSAVRSVVLRTSAGEPTLWAFLAAADAPPADAADAPVDLAELCPRVRVVVAWGEPAARAAVRVCRRPTLGLGMPRPIAAAWLAAAGAEARAAVYLEAEPALNLRMIRALLPAARTVGVLAPDPAPGWLDPLRAEADRLGFRLEVIAAATDLEAVRALRGRLPGLDAVLLAPEPSLINEWSLKPLLLMTVRQGVPAFGGPSARYVAAGVLAAVVADEAALPAQARPLLAELAQNRAPPPAYPAAVRLALNPTVARTLGVSAPAMDRARALLARP
jgi:putative tryptophan/tyrosine transport system substrate-binding protein